MTVTQPNGVAFLSPVLVMAERQRIPGTKLDLPFDAFAVPAAHRNVKAALFSAEQAALVHPEVKGQAVLFGVDDERDRPLPGAVALARDGETVQVGGLRLRARIIEYPAIEYMAVPSFAAVAIGVFAIAGGFIAVSRRSTGEPLRGA